MLISSPHAVVVGWLTHWCMTHKVKSSILSYVLCKKLDTWHIMIIKFSCILN